MDKIPQPLDNQLLDLIDGTLSASDKEKLEQQLAASPELKRRFDELVQVNYTLKSSVPDQPSKTFTQQVMAKLDSYPVPTGLSARNGLLLLAGVLVAIGIGSLLLANGVFDSPGSIDLNNMVLQNQYMKEPLPSIPFNGKLVVNIIIMLNIILAFLVLDRTILKPWFDKRADMHY
ncbi:MAG: hypothetical protein KF725_08010 [Cyclobacteriaceae bacterium]|nr:hypothetical protein [Cyclobacteriaceae bacterium]UYN87898.1 MAG: hypothetical protein KIT51_06505 [Cyclobacteriaceae bacterium]